MPRPNETPERDSALLTVAAVRTAREGERTEVLFNERHQVFTLRPDARTSERHLRRLNEVSAGSPVRVALDPRRGLVQSIELPTDEEIEGFQRLRTLLDEPEKSFRVDLEAIDPTRFNVVDHFLDVPIFSRCKKIVPNYKRAKEIFDFCAEQSCHLGTATITPCIPFQYVRDGCYARAHKMRWIITEKYRYCCEKVFSFANQNLDTLAVQANKWGGCCVFWWYHVAPLIRVKVTLGKMSAVLAMVIDPGMFDKPVLLSSWLYAQENAACSADANVSMYSIQPGSAYTPANYAGTAFTTDPNYVQTDATLIAYKNLVTC